MPAAESSPSSQSTYGRNHKFIDPKALMSIQHLEWRANVVVEGFWSGLHRSPYHGFSVEFTEYRSYSPGDDLRYLDWKLLARSDRYHIKKYEDETNLSCMICLDRSKSMLFKSGIIKEDYANTLAATLATFLEKQGDAVGVLSSTPRSNPTFRHEPSGHSGNSSRPWRNLAREHRPLWKTP